MTIEEAKTFLDNLKVCIEEHPIVADWLVEIADRKTEPTISKMEQVDEPKTQMKTQNSNLTFEKDECAKEYEELGLKELKELIEADRKDEPQTCDTCKYGEDKHRYAHICNECGVGINNYEPKDEPQTERSE